MKVLVVEDEPLAQQRLIQLLGDIPLVQQVYAANNGLQAVELCDSEKPDLVLMDIRMPGMDGLETAGHLSRLDETPAIIFVTAYDEYALDAFRVHAVDYLLKPVRRDKLQEAIQRAARLNRAQLAALEGEPKARTNITARISGNIKLIPVHEILFFQAEQKYVTVRYLRGETIIEDTLKELQDEFGNTFVRVHRNALVATKYITGVHKDSEGRSFLTLQHCDKSLEISRRHLTEIKKLLASL